RSGRAGGPSPGRLLARRLSARAVAWRYRLLPDRTPRPLEPQRPRGLHLRLRQPAEPVRPGGRPARTAVAAAGTAAALHGPDASAAPAGAGHGADRGGAAVREPGPAGGVAAGVRVA